MPIINAPNKNGTIRLKAVFMPFSRLAEPFSAASLAMPIVAPYAINSIIEKTIIVTINQPKKTKTENTASPMDTYPSLRR